MTVQIMFASVYGRNMVSVIRGILVSLVSVMIGCSGAATTVPRPNTPDRHADVPTKQLRSDIVPVTSIRWRSWSYDAFEEAKAQGKPVIVYWHAGWCEWCAKMDKVTFDDWLVKNLIDSELIAVAVDMDSTVEMLDEAGKLQKISGSELARWFNVTVIPSAFVIKHKHDAENNHWKLIDTFTNYMAPLQMTTWLSNVIAIAKRPDDAPPL